MDRAAELIESLGLLPHPEGGYFREIHRSAGAVVPEDGRDARSALTLIYFLLGEGQVSRWHRVASDETWHFHEGAPLELVVTDPDFERVSTRRLATWSGDAEPVSVVPAGHWQAARTTGTYTLVSCAVGPGFEFADFAMLRDVADEAKRMRKKRPELASLL